MTWIHKNWSTSTLQYEVEVPQLSHMRPSVQNYVLLNADSSYPTDIKVPWEMVQIFLFFLY